jgi:hypothetical protein
MLAPTVPGTNTPEAAAGALPVMRRLTAREYDNTVRDLLGDESAPASAFDPDPTAAGFDNQVTLLGVTTSRARQYWTAAERLALTADLTELTHCNAAMNGEQACAEQFVVSFGKRAFRRPLDAAELASLLKVYAAGREGADHDAGLRQVIRAALVMPPFLYRLDVSPSEPLIPGAAPLDQHQVASRLSYTFLQSMPDDALLSAADAGQLATPEQIAAQVLRLLGDPRAQLMSQDFYERWLGLDALSKLSKSATDFPSWSDALRDALQAELREFLKHSLWTEGGSLASFFTANHGFRNQVLSEHYGDSQVSGESPTLTTLAPERSAGFLTSGGLLALLSTPEHTDPVRRGKFVRERLLCQPVPPPPPGVNAVFPKIEGNVTTRQRFAQHQNDPVCAGCHSLMDGIGLGFESFDAVGRFRTEENGLPIDASGEIVSSDIDGAFIGPRALAEKLAQSRVVQDCMIATWFRYLTGREANDHDAATFDELRPALLGGGQKAMLEAFARTRVFLTRYQGDAP